MSLRWMVLGFFLLTPFNEGVANKIPQLTPDESGFVHAHISPNQRALSNERELPAYLSQMLKSEGSPLRFRIMKTKEFQPGISYYRLQQMKGPFPIWGKKLVAEVRNNKLTYLSGNIDSQVEEMRWPRFSFSETLDKALPDLQDQFALYEGSYALLGEPQLGIWHDKEGKEILSYKVVISLISALDGLHIEEIYLDSDSGELLHHASRIYHQLQRRIYDLRRQCLTNRMMAWAMNSAQGKNWLKNFLTGNPVNPTQDAHTQGAYENLGLSYWFYYHFLGRDSYDGNGAPLRATNHVLFEMPSSNPYPSPYPRCSGGNAFFAPDINIMIFGEGNGEMMSNPAGALDIVAHELSHGFTFNESNLEYKDEPGAINEALSDIFAAGVEAWVLSGGNAEGNPEDGISTSSKVWKAGEDAVSEDYIRHMDNPTLDGHSVDNYEELKTGQEDNGFVHLNSGIMNLAFYLLAEGGTHPRNISDQQVTGIGISKALKIYYHAANFLFQEKTNFKKARLLLSDAAQTLYGECSPESIAVHESLAAVLIPGAFPICEED